VTRPGGYQYTAEGGFKPYTWEAEGTGVTIDDEGYVTLADDACGAFTVTVTDACGQSAAMDARITNAGHWEAGSVVANQYEGQTCTYPNSYGAGGGECISGKVKYDVIWCGGGLCTAIGCPLDNPCPGLTPYGTGQVMQYVPYEWVC